MNNNMMNNNMMNNNMMNNNMMNNNINNMNNMNNMMNMNMNNNMTKNISKSNVNINISKLRSEVQVREDRKYKTFEKILDLCYQKILSINKTSDECCCTFICPHVVFGLPLFNLMDCIKFIMEKLVEKDFYVHLALPNHIFISWKSENNESKHLQSYLALTPHYQLKQLQLENSYGNSNSANYNNSNSNKKLFMNKMHNPKDKKYRPINDYTQTNEIYTNADNSSNSGNNDNSNINDINLFRNKIDELFT